MMVALSIIAGVILCAWFGWWVVGWWWVDRPAHMLELAAREADIERVERGKPVNYVAGVYTPEHANRPTLLIDDELNARAPHMKRHRCTNCGRNCRRHIYHPGWASSLSFDVALCEDCVALRPEKDDPFEWMGFDLIRSI